MEEPAAVAGLDVQIADAIEAEQRGTAERRVTPGRIAALTVTGVSLYFVAPSIVEVFASWDRLDDVRPGWLVAIAAAVALSTACVWVLQGVALRSDDWFAIATSQLAGNAVSQVVPGGQAAGVAVQFRMLRTAGIDVGRSASALTATSLLLNGAVLLLPVLALPAILSSPTQVASPLVTAAWLGLGAFLALAVATSVLLFAERPLVAAALGAERVRNAVLRRRPPLTGLDQRVLRERDLIRTALGSRLGHAVLASLGRTLFDYLALVLALIAVGADPDPPLVLLAYVTSAVLRMVPLTPGGLGFVEAGLTATLALAGIGASEAVLATLAYRLASYWLPLLAGAGAAALFARRTRAQP